MTETAQYGPAPFFDHGYVENSVRLNYDGYFAMVHARRIHRVGTGVVNSQAASEMSPTVNSYGH